MFLREGGTLTPFRTEKARPWACPSSYSGAWISEWPRLSNTDCSRDKGLDLTGDANQISFLAIVDKSNIPMMTTRTSFNGQNLDQE